MSCRMTDSTHRCIRCDSEVDDGADRIRELETQLAEARKTALELERHAALEGSAPSVKWTGPDGRVRSLLTSTPMETRAALAHARDAALEEAAKEVERYRDPRFADDSAAEGNAFFTDAARVIRALKTVTPPTGGE